MHFPNLGTKEDIHQGFPPSLGWNVKTMFEAGRAQHQQIANKMSKYKTILLNISKTKWTTSGSLRLTPGQTVLYSGHGDNHTKAHIWCIFNTNVNQSWCTYRAERVETRKVRKKISHKIQAGVRLLNTISNGRACKNPRREDEDPNQKKEVELDWPQVKKKYRTM